VELFSGAGGLAMGVSLAGFTPEAVIEWDKWSCDTIRENQRRQNPLVSDWPLYEQDVRLFDFHSLPNEIDLVSGGPPCQPFSLGGKHKASSDKRDMFPTTIDVIRRLRPKAFLIENVKGLTRATFADYLRYTLLGLTFPEAVRDQNETWLDHLERLEKEKTSGQTPGLTYDVIHRALKAADYGVPQRRERVFIVGFRRDLEARWSFPEPTHSLESLIYSQWVSGEYWDRHKIPPGKRPRPDPPIKARLAHLNLHIPTAQPWLTVRDALQGLPDPRDAKASAAHQNHIFQAGARAYAGHTGSPLDWPAKTLKAGDHGVPGGENMLALPSGELRYFTVRESARLQTFPDNYVFNGSWTESTRQLGNAVPVVLARVMAVSVAEALLAQPVESMTLQRL
jgi:DNA (cytosine-5)-methyltransferase 1